MVEIKYFATGAGTAIATTVAEKTLTGKVDYPPKPDAKQIFVATVAAPILEEALTRVIPIELGYKYGGVTGEKLGALVGGIAFTLFHGIKYENGTPSFNWRSVITTIPATLVFTYIYLKERDKGWKNAYLSSALAHSGANSAVLAMGEIFNLWQK